MHFDTPLISDGKERLAWVVDSSQKLFTFATRKALVAKLVDAPDLGSGVARRVGSSPIRRTHIQQSLTASSDNGSQGLLFFHTHPSKAYGFKQGVRGQAGLMSSVRPSGGAE